MSIIALGDRVLVEQFHEEIVSSGLVIPDEAKDSMKIAKGRVVNSGSYLHGLADGDVGYFNKFSGDRITTPDGKELLVLKVADLLAKDMEGEAKVYSLTMSTS